jgi:hypothetical protein
MPVNTCVKRQASFIEVLALRHFKAMIKAMDENDRGHACI